MNVQENPPSDSTGDTEVGQDKAIWWISQLILDKGTILFFFPVDKIRPTLLLGTENRWPVYLYDTTVSIPPENTQNMMVETAGAYRPAKGTQEIPLPLQGKASTPQRS